MLKTEIMKREEENYDDVRIFKTEKIIKRR